MGYAVFLCVCDCVLAQGLVNFSNDSRCLVSKWQGGPLPANGGFVELLWAPGETPVSSWSPFENLTSWLARNPGWSVIQSSKTAIGPVPGRFTGGAIAVPTAVPGARIEAAVAGWEGNYSTFDAAFAAGSFAAISYTFSLTTGNPTTTPAGLPSPITGPGAFPGLPPPTVPEPTAASLFILGCLAYLTSSVRLRSAA